VWEANRDGDAPQLPKPLGKDCLAKGGAKLGRASRMCSQQLWDVYMHLCLKIYVLDMYVFLF